MIALCKTSISLIVLVIFSLLSATFTFPVTHSECSHSSLHSSHCENTEEDCSTLDHAHDSDPDNGHSDEYSHNCSTCQWLSKNKQQGVYHSYTYRAILLENLYLLFNTETLVPDLPLSSNPRAPPFLKV